MDGVIDFETGYEASVSFDTAASVLPFTVTFSYADGSHSYALSRTHLIALRTAIGRALREQKDEEARK